MDDEAFDVLMQASNSAMVVVAARDADRVDACLVGFHSQCSIDPLRYAVWLSKANHTFRIASHADVLSVHWLRRGDVGLAEHVGAVSLDRDPHKMDRLRWQIGAHGGVELDGVAGLLVGRILERHDDGDHVCFVLEPLEARATAGPVLRFADVQFLPAGHDVHPSVPPRDPPPDIRAEMVDPGSPRAETP
jgi:flavin reductase (DIM6/NTAB) family NADH-FMN oxidoreductase RutF